MAIGYDSPYGEHRQFLPYTVIIQRGFKNNTWTKTIQQWSFDGKQARVLNPENNFQRFSENGKAFVLLNLDLDSLNLPNQFYVYFRSYVDFLNGGQAQGMKKILKYVSGRLLPFPSKSCFLQKCKRVLK
jgi:hypothetical protein